jgi:hypothetical protein
VWAGWPACACRGLGDRSVHLHTVLRRAWN